MSCFYSVFQPVFITVLWTYLILLLISSNKRHNAANNWYCTYLICGYSTMSYTEIWQHSFGRALKEVFSCLKCQNFFPTWKLLTFYHTIYILHKSRKLISHCQKLGNCNYVTLSEENYRYAHGKQMPKHQKKNQSRTLKMGTIILPSICLVRLFFLKKYTHIYW